MPTPILSTEDFANRHAERCNYTLVKVLSGQRRFQVRCNACKELRIIQNETASKTAFTPRKCPCQRQQVGKKPMTPEEYVASYSLTYDFTVVKVLADRKFKVRCNACKEVRIEELSNGNFGHKCECQIIPTGPAPLSPKAFAKRHSKALNYTLVKVLDDRLFKVKCNDCEKIRNVGTGFGGFRGTGSQCVCTLKHRAGRLQSTIVTHNEEIYSKGYTDYVCLDLASTNKDYSVYRHSCGNEFSMARNCFLQCTEPCGKCRVRGYTNEEYLQIMRKYAKKIVPLEPYLCYGSRPNGMLHKYVKCGHVRRLSPAYFTANKPCPRCDICYPTHVWFRFKIKGRRFKTRSRTEQEFVKFLVSKGVDVNRIEYEPTDSKIAYYNPVKDRQATYSPDFKVGDVHFEVKDLSSLGLRPYHWQDMEEALIENRAKYQASVTQFNDYRVYVHIKGKFYRTRKFWKSKEKQRLLSI